MKNYILQSCSCSPFGFAAVRSPFPGFKSPPAKQAKMKRFLDKVTPVENEKFDLMVAEFFYACNVPFAACESIYFKKLMNALRPAYNPPHRRQLSGKLLDKAHEKIGKRKSELISKMGKQVTLLVDGWQNSSSNRQTW